MKTFDSKDRLCRVEYSGSGPDELYVEAATYVDDESDVPEEELEYIQKNRYDDLYYDWVDCLTQGNYDSEDDLFNWED